MTQGENLDRMKIKQGIVLLNVIQQASSSQKNKLLDLVEKRFEKGTWMGNKDKRKAWKEKLEDIIYALSPQGRNTLVKEFGIQKGVTTYSINKNTLESMYKKMQIVQSQEAAKTDGQGNTQVEDSDKEEAKKETPRAQILGEASRQIAKRPIDPLARLKNAITKANLIQENKLLDLVEKRFEKGTWMGNKDEREQRKEQLKKSIEALSPEGRNTLVIEFGIQDGVTAYSINKNTLESMYKKMEIVKSQEAAKTDGQGNTTDDNWNEVTL